MTEIRICPTCGLEAVRLPEKDTADEIAFQCLTGIDFYKNPHPYFREPRPPVVEVTKTMVVPITDEVHVTTEPTVYNEPVQKSKQKRQTAQHEKED